MGRIKLSLNPHDVELDDVNYHSDGTPIPSENPKKSKGKTRHR